MKTIVKGSRTKEPTLLELENRELSRVAARNGFVLLENDGTLPLERKPIALYGAGARMTVKGGRGSGEVRNRYSVTIAEGLENAGYTILTKSWLDRFDKYYADTYEAYRVEMEERVKGLEDFHSIQRAMRPFNHPTGMSVVESDIVDSDTAIYVLARQAGEGKDRKNERGDYLLSEVEEDNLKFVSSRYKNFILVINVGGLVDLSILDEIHVSSLVYFTQGGEEGGNALADVISGDYNFSGKLTTSWPYNFQDIPSSRNYSYFSSDEFEQNYEEGVFVGYRYFSSFNKAPRYAFGYGKSYTDFSLSFVGLDLDIDRVTLKSSVENIGVRKGREVVQLYASLPFAPNREKMRLVAFSKTKELDGGEKEIVELSFSMKDIATYDEKRASWILPKGEYLLSLGNSSDNLTLISVLVVEEEREIEKCTNICQSEKIVKEMEREESVCNTLGLPHFVIDSYIPECIVHTYEKPEVEVDPLVSSMTDEELVTLVVGASTAPTKLQVCALGSSGNTTGDLYDTLGIPNIVLSDGPAGLNLSAWVVQTEDGSVKGARIKENLEAYKRYLFGANGKRMIARMALPEEGEMFYQYATAWPCSELLAQSFDTELLERVGDGVGKEMEAYGVTIWLAPGMNIHRNPLCGRTFEYYSEDPLVSGKMAASIVKGVQKHPGKGMSVKHFVGNNCELNRNWSSSNMSEKTLREIYLRGFEIAVKEAEPLTVMASYNKINGTYVVNNYDLCAKVLRNEWGFEGLVMSDWDSMKANAKEPEVPVSGDVKKAQSSQMDLVCPGRKDQRIALLKGLEKGEVKREDLECSGTRILSLIRKNSVLESK